MDITKIPKFAIYIAVALLVIFILYNVYIIYILPYFESYQRFFSVNCIAADNESLVVITAKTNLSNIIIYDFYKNSNCSINYINQYSSDGCVLSNYPVIGSYYVRIYYNVNGEEYQTIVECKEESQGLLSSLLSFIK